MSVDSASKTLVRNSVFLVPGHPKTQRYMSVHFVNKNANELHNYRRYKKQPLQAPCHGSYIDHSYFRWPNKLCVRGVKITDSFNSNETQSEWKGLESAIKARPPHHNKTRSVNHAEDFIGTDNNSLVCLGKSCIQLLHTRKHQDNYVPREKGTTWKHL